MAYKINGTTVVDNSRNVCACCVTSCCITASDRMDAPSGTTAQRPSSPATGSIYFDTDLGALLSYDGSNWIAPSGGVGMGLSSGLVNSDTEAWSAAFISVDAVQCRGQTSSCQFCCCGQFQYTCDLSPLYGLCNKINGNTPLIGCCLTTRLGELERCTGHATVYGGECCKGCHPGAFADGITYPIRMGCNTCNGIHARIYQDGSFEVTTGEDKCSFYGTTVCANRQTTIALDKYGNNHIHQSFTINTGACSCCRIFTPENSAGYIDYLADGLNAPLANLRLPARLYTGTVRDFALCREDCAAFEICSDFLHQNGYEVCDTALMINGGYTGYLDKYSYVGGNCAGTAFYPLETGFNLGTGFIRYISGAGVRYVHESSNPCTVNLSLVRSDCYCLGCVSQQMFTYLSKCPQYNYRDPSFYTAVSTTPSGVKIGTSDEGFTNSIGYFRSLHGTNTLCSVNGLYSGVSYTKNAAYWFSQDKCKLYHVYFRHALCGSGWAKFSCSGNVCFNCGYWPATEVIDTTNGCVICSVYYCEYKDADVEGSTYPYSICENCLSFCCTGPYDSTIRVAGQGLSSWIDGPVQTIDGSRNCMIRSCACPSRVYMLPASTRQGQGGSRIAVFNECTLNFECTFPAMLFQTPTLCFQFAKLIGGSAGCCVTGNPCACMTCTFNCTFTSSSTPPCIGTGNVWHSLTCSHMPNNVFGCSTTVDGFYHECSEACGGNYYYINPTNDHLVMLASIGHNSSCVLCRYWFGAICWDIENCCISRVETLYPTSGDKCLYALCCGPQKWGSCSISDITAVSHVTTLNKATACLCSLKKELSYLAIAKTFGTRNHTCGGVTVLTTNRLHRDNAICSSCCWCYNNASFDDCLGYFGPSGVGKCTCFNSCSRTGSKHGLTMQTNFGIARVPWEQKLSCSGMFEEDAGVKCIFEMVLGCHELGCALYSNDQSGIDCIYKCAFTPEFNCIVDITCQYTCDCTAVFTWGSSCWCSKQRWIVFDTSTSNVCWCQIHASGCNAASGTFGSFMCCDVGGCLADFCTLETADPQAYGAKMCTKMLALQCVPCLNTCRIPTVLMCVDATTMFKGHRDHRSLSNPKGIHYVQGYDQELENSWHAYSSCACPFSGWHYGWFSYNNTPCCNMTGVNGSMKYWFDKYYARIL